MTCFLHKGFHLDYSLGRVEQKASILALCISPRIPGWSKVGNYIWPAYPPIFSVITVITTFGWLNHVESGFLWRRNIKPTWRDSAPSSLQRRTPLQWRFRAPPTWRRWISHPNFWQSPPQLVEKTLKDMKTNWESSFRTGGWKSRKQPMTPANSEKWKTASEFQTFRNI